MPIAGLAEVGAQTGTGPRNVHAAEFIANMTSADSTIGAVTTSDWCSYAGVWTKVGSIVGSTTDASSRVASIWVDSDMEGTVNGENYSLWITPSPAVDAIFGFYSRTSAALADNLFYFDSTCAAVDPISNTSLKVLLDTTQCYIPLSTADGSFTTAYPIYGTVAYGDIADATVNVNTLTATGTFSHGSQAGTFTGLKISNTVSGSLGMWAMGQYTVMTETADSLTGFSSAGAFEIAQAGAVTNHHDSAVIDLRDNDSSSGGGAHPAGSYIRIRQSGSKNSATGRMNFANFYSEDEASTYDSNRMLSATSAQTQTHSIRCFINDTPIYLMATTTAPAA